MKRTLALLLCVCVMFGLAACGGKKGKAAPPDGSTMKESELAPGVQKSVPNYADFTMFKVMSGKKVAASVSDSIHFENREDGQIYVDMILDITNTSEDFIPCTEVVKLSATNAKGESYPASIYALETGDRSILSQYVEIAPLYTERLHCAISVPEEETDLTLKLTVKDREYTYAYQVGNIDVFAEEIEKGDSVEEPGFADFQFKGIEYADKVIPSNAKDGYSGFQTSDPDKVFLVVKYDVRNRMSERKLGESFVGVRARFGEEEYYGFLSVEDSEGAFLVSYEEIEPKDTRPFYFLFEVPKTVNKDELFLTISFNGKEYHYKGK